MTKVSIQNRLVNVNHLTVLCNIKCAISRRAFAFKVCLSHLSLRRSLRRLLMRLIQEQVIQRKDAVVKDESFNWQVVLLHIRIDRSYIDC